MKGAGHIWRGAAVLAAGFHGAKERPQRSPFRFGSMVASIVRLALSILSAADNRAANQARLMRKRERTKVVF